MSYTRSVRASSLPVLMGSGYRGRPRGEAPSVAILYNECKMLIPLTLRVESPSLSSMEFRPTPDQEAFIRDAIEAGRIDSAEDAAKEALALWEERERRRSEILAAVDIAQASTARGEGIEITTEFHARTAWRLDCHLGRQVSRLRTLNQC